MSSNRAIGLSSLLLIPMQMLGCASHVLLEAPPANAPGEQRVEAYDDLRPMEHQITVTTTKNSSFISDSVLQLNNGVKVRLPEDLLPLVPANSPAAESMRTAYRERKANQWLAFSAYAGTITGLILAGVGFGTDNNALKYGGAGMVIGGVVCFPLTNYFGSQYLDSTARAYKQYDEGLRRRLNVCNDADRIVPCP